MSRQAWLDSLKAGDTVIVDANFSERVTKVERRTPTGRIILAGGATYGASGYPTGKVHSVSCLVQPTQERMDSIRHRKLVLTLKNAEYSKLTLNQLRRIKGIIDGHDAPACILKMILNDLPTNRDWLDPDLESTARKIVEGVE